MNKKLIFSIIVALIALAGVFAYQKYNKPEKISSNIDTSDWLTYRNEEYGFELKYPKEWVVNDKNKKIVTLNSYGNEERKQKMKSGEIYGEGYMEDINIYFYSDIEQEPENIGNNLNAKNIEEFIKRNPLISDSKIIFFANQKAWECTRGGFGAYYSILVDHNSHLYQILFGNKEKESDLSIIEKAILSSFKFID